MNEIDLVRFQGRTGFFFAQTRSNRPRPRLGKKGLRTTHSAKK